MQETISPVSKTVGDMTWVLGQNGLGKNGMDKNSIQTQWFWKNGMDKIVWKKWYG